MLQTECNHATSTTAKSLGGSADWTQLTIQTLPEKPDLVIWPEGALGGPINPNDTRPYQVLGGNL